ncbi:MAG: hypothetical protein K6G88_11695 [Lachnospiraceae bacterium]|nr:hypothetical protein [Lachnospiraceae bacterium]
MIRRMHFEMLMNKKPAKGDIVSPGGYEFVSNGVTYAFDFLDSGYTYDKNTVIYDGTNLDTTAFPDAAKITVDILKDAVFTDFYVDIDGNKDLYPVKLKFCVIEFIDDNGKISVYQLTKENLVNIEQCFQEYKKAI